MNSSGIAAAIRGALGFLRSTQLPSGQFRTYMGRDLVHADDGVFDPSPYATSLIGYSLGFCDEPEAAALSRRAAGFLRGIMEPGGVWRFWTAEHDHHKVIPPDVDDTACISYFLREQGVRFADNRHLLLANRRNDGVFYTWIAPRWPPPRNLAFWRTALTRLRSPIGSRLFWRLNEAAPNDVDAVVNANVVLYLGGGPGTAGAFAHLAKVLERGEDSGADKWHLNPFTFHYTLARCADLGFPDGILARVRERSLGRLLEGVRTDGSIGDDALDTALAVCALHSWGAERAVGRRACAALLAAQGDDGSWPIVPMFYGGPKRIYGWGSRELTTGFCIEALARSCDDDEHADAETGVR
jgi:hypothetical protein